MTNEPDADRRQLTFEQAEGVDPLPTQLQTKQLSEKLRARLWKVVYESLQEDTSYPPMGGPAHFGNRWKTILYDYLILHDHLMADEFKNDSKVLIGPLKAIFANGSYTKIFGFLQFVIRHRICPDSFRSNIEWALLSGHAAYRILDKTTIIPITSQAEGDTVQRAFADLCATEFHGARSHLRAAGSYLTAGEYASSVRESIHSVESVARTLAPSGKLGEALAKLEVTSAIHGGLKHGFASIYGYTSDAKGIRHPLLEDPKANVDEADALFMIGACAAFVSYMIQPTSTGCRPC
jgi:hypothetical protein